jgi:adenosine/AMP kinase
MAERPHKERQMELSAIPIEIPDGLNVIVGQAHFIKAVEDLHEALAGANRTFASDLRSARRRVRA